MRNIILVILIFIVSACVTIHQTDHIETTVEKVFYVKGYSKDMIYDGINIWMAENFKSAKAVIEYQDKEGGKIIGKGNIKYPCDGYACSFSGKWRIPFTVKVDIKDNKFRLTYTNMRLTWPSSYSNGVVQTGYDGPITKKETFDNVKRKLLDMGENMRIHLIKSTNDNW